MYMANNTKSNILFAYKYFLTIQVLNMKMNSYTLGIH